MEQIYSTELKALKVKAETNEKIVSILEDKIAKNRKEIKQVYNGNYSESDAESDNIANNEVDQSDKNIEIQNGNHNKTNDDFLDQTFLNPSAGFNCND